MSIQETIANALALWSEKHAESTVHCQGVYFSTLLKTAEENGFDVPCQKLYDLFLEGATTPATHFSRTQVVRAVDFVAATHAVTADGSFFNEPPFPTGAEAQAVLSSVHYPISEPVDISIMISRGADIIEDLGISRNGKRQYWHAWRDIRTYFFLRNSSMDYDTRTLEEYFAGLDTKYDARYITQTYYYMHRKAAIVLGEIADTGCFQWKRFQRNSIHGMDDPGLEEVRYQYLAYLKENNYSENTIRLRDYVFRNTVEFAEIHTVSDLFNLSVNGVGNILKGFAERYSDMSEITPVIRMMLRYFYEQGLLEENRAEMVMAPFCHHGTLPCYIPVEEDGKFYQALENETKRNTAIILLARKLGLRAGDICNLTFSQIDWDKDKIRLNQSKTGEPIVLPLLPEVGNAIFEYISEERPKRNDGYPYVFLRSKAPFTKLTRLYEISENFIKRTGIERRNGTQRGTHLYRRTLTNRLLQDGVSHQVITDALGHASKESDKPYIPMEEHMLRQCAIGLGAIGMKFWEGGVGK